MTISKKKFKKALEEGRIVVTGTLFSRRNGWTGYKVWENTTSGLTEIKKACRYWDDEHQCYDILVVEASRPWEIILAIGNQLGLKCSEMRKRYKVLI